MTTENEKDAADRERVAYDKIQALIEDFRASGLADIEMGGLLHGAAIMLAMKTGMAKDFFIGVGSAIWDRLAACQEIATPDAVDEVVREAKLGVAETKKGVN